MVVGSHSARRGKGWLAETGTDIQYSVPKTNPGQRDEAVIDGLSVSRPHIPVTLPAVCGRRPPDVGWNGVLCHCQPRSGLAVEGTLELVQVVVVVPG